MSDSSPEIRVKNTASIGEVDTSFPATRGLVVGSEKWIRASLDAEIASGLFDVDFRSPEIVGLLEKFKEIPSAPEEF